MTTLSKARATNYDRVYLTFDSPLMQRVRREAYAQDIGQNSWVSAEEIEQAVGQLNLRSSSRLLDLGCGPGGPLTFVVARVGCVATGTDISSPAIESARARATSLAVAELIDFRVTNLNEPVQCESASFDAVMSMDVVIHLRDRAAAFREVARTLTRGGRFLFTDAGIVTGPLSSEEIRRRALRGITQLVPPGYNEHALELAGFRLIEVQDRTPGLLENAGGRLAARAAHRVEVQAVEGQAQFEDEQRFLETVVALAERGALSRMMFLAERGA